MPQGFRICFYPLLILLMANLNALVDAVHHPEIPYFDEGHLQVGVITGLVTAILFWIREASFRREQARLAVLNSQRAATNQQLRQLNGQLAAAAGQIKHLMKTMVTDNDFSARFESRAIGGGREDGWPGGEAVAPDGDEAPAGGALNPEDDGDSDVCPEAKSNSVLDLGETFNELIAILEDRHRESQQRKHELRMVLDALPGYAFFKDRHGVYQAANRPFCDAVECAHDQIVGKTDFDLFSREIAGEYEGHDQQVLQSGKAISLEEVPWLDQGRLLIISLRKVPLTNEAGQVVGLIGLGFDMTERVRAEQALGESEERYRLATEAGHIAVWRIFLANGRVDSGGALERMLGYAEGEVGDLLSLAHPDDREWLQILWQDVVSGHRERYDVEHRLLHKDGTLRWVSVRGKVVQDEQGRPVGMAGTTEDITERIKAGQEKSAIQAQLQQAQKLESIGRLAAGVAHEINTPTQYISDNTGFLEDAFRDLHKLLDAYEHLRQTAEQQNLLAGEVRQVAVTRQRVDAGYLLAEIPKAIQQSREGLKRVTRIVGAMKEFSHPGSEDKEEVDLNRMIENTVTVAQNEWKYVAEMVLDLDPTLPFVPCLPGEFNQVILNLVINAAHAIAEVVGDGSQGKGTITLSTRRESDWVTVRVQDTGGGILENISDKIFDPFFTTKPVGKGTGQGLAIARAVVVDRHHGTLDFESPAGGGTTFLVQLPLNTQTTLWKKKAA